VVELFQDADLSREAREMGTVPAIVAFVFAAVVIVVGIRRSFCVWMILTAHHSPVVRDMAFITVANVSTLRYVSGHTFIVILKVDTEGDGSDAPTAFVNWVICPSANYESRFMCEGHERFD